MGSHLRMASITLNFVYLSITYGILEKLKIRRSQGRGGSPPPPGTNPFYLESAAYDLSKSASHADPQAGMELSNPRLLHVGAEARLALKDWAEAEGVSVNAIVVSVLKEFFRLLKKSNALREELRLLIRAHRGFMPS